MCTNRKKVSSQKKKRITTTATKTSMHVYTRIRMVFNEHGPASQPNTHASKSGEYDKAKGDTKKKKEKTQRKKRTNIDQATTHMCEMSVCKAKPIAYGCNFRSFVCSVLNLYTFCGKKTLNHVYNSATTGLFMFRSVMPCKCAVSCMY